MFGKELPDFTAKALALLEKRAGEILEEYGFYLAGGTALTLHIKHRVSYDLDWFTEETLDPLTLARRFEDIGLSISNLQTSSGTLHVSIEGCELSFFEYKYPFIEKPVLFKDHKFKIAALEDIALMKITAIADRGTKKDFVDLYFLIRELGGLSKILSNFPSKYSNANLYHYLKSLTYFEDADKMPELNMLKEAKWEEVKSTIINEVNKLEILPV